MRSTTSRGASKKARAWRRTRPSAALKPSRAKRSGRAPKPRDSSATSRRGVIARDTPPKRPRAAPARPPPEGAARRAREAGETARRAAETAGEKAGEAFKGAKSYYERASKAYDRSARVTRASTAATRGIYKAGGWLKENPGKAALVTFSLVTGTYLGRSFPGLDAVLLGSHPHWFTHSALPVYGLRKASEKFEEYLSRQEALAASGDLEEAERERVEFERKIVKYVGAPLLGSFSCAAGAAMWAQIFQPGHITGAPISWLLGGNPLLEGVWLFSNGVICFHQGYKFFMMALADQEEVARVVKEIKGLLPAGEAA